MKRRILPILLVVLLLSISLGTALAVGAIAIQISPSNIALDSNSPWLTIHADIAFSVVAPDSVSVNGVDAHHIYSDDLGNLVAKFEMDNIKPLLRTVASDRFTFILTGDTKENGPFTGSGEVRIITCGGNRQSASFSVGKRFVNRSSLFSRFCGPD